MHLNRVITKYDLNMFYIAGPGHGGPALVANTYLEGTYSEIYPDVSQDEAGMKKLFTQFSFPGGISSHVAPTTPGSIHEGGELGYSLSHAFGAAFDNPDLIVACVIGDGEAETGPLATAWHSTKFLDPVGDGAVLPILHLNGYKISNPTVLARIEPTRTRPVPARLRLGTALRRRRRPRRHARTAWPPPSTRPSRAIHAMQHNARTRQRHHPTPLADDRAALPEGLDRTESRRRAPRSKGRSGRIRCRCSSTQHHPEHVEQLDDWMRSYKPGELFDHMGGCLPDLAALAPQGQRRMGANPHTNRWSVCASCVMPDYHAHAVAVSTPGAVNAEDTRVLGAFLRDVIHAQ